MTTLNINLSTEQFIMMFQQFSKREQKKIVEKISHIANDKPKKLSLSFAFLNDEIEDVYSDENLKVRYW
jgi:hypothetical protein